jgi:hypothetical protein
VASWSFGVFSFYGYVLYAAMAAILWRQVWPAQDLLDWQYFGSYFLYSYNDKQVILAYCKHDISYRSAGVYQALNWLQLLHGAVWRTLQDILRDDMERKRRACLLMGNNLLLANRQALFSLVTFGYLLAVSSNILIYFFLESPMYLIKKGLYSEAKKNLEYIAKINGRKYTFDEKYFTSLDRSTFKEFAPQLGSLLSDNSLHIDELR